MPAQQAASLDRDPPIANGTVRSLEGKTCRYYDGYWIRQYVAPPDTLEARRRLIAGLSRRLFHHTEPGINTPGNNLDAARVAYENQTDPVRKRVNAAMLAGALFNRATDIFTSVVELQAKGLHISPDNELMRDCGQYFREALELGGKVKHHSGEEGIDELWGEPFKAFTLPIEDFYESRYVKIAQTMRDMDRVADKVVAVFCDEKVFDGLEPAIREFAQAAKLEAEIMRTDPDIFDIWPRYVAAAEALEEFEPQLPHGAPKFVVQRVNDGIGLIRQGRALIGYLAGARVPMPKTTDTYLKQAETYAAELRAARNSD